MSEDDVRFGYRLQLFDCAARTSVSEASRAFGEHRSTFYRWKRPVDRHGLEVLRPRERSSEATRRGPRPGVGDREGEDALLDHRRQLVRHLRPAPRSVRHSASSRR